VEIADQLSDIQHALRFLNAELILAVGIFTTVIAGFFKFSNTRIYLGAASMFFIACAISAGRSLEVNEHLFGNMLIHDGFSAYLKILVNVGGLFTCILALKSDSVRRHTPEFATLLLTTVLGCHFLVMSSNLLLIFVSLEIVSICSYVLAAYAFNREGSEGSLKYFLYGSVASAVMLYGFSILYGLTGSLDFTSVEFARMLIEHDGKILLLSGGMALSGFLFKIASAPFHSWAPDVYQAAPVPVIAFLSTVPKLAGIGALTRFLLAMNVYGQSTNDWQVIICFIAILSITVGNFGALAQQNVKRMMAWSSIAQSGFILVGLAAFLPQGMSFMLFYGTIYLLMNFLVFIYLEFFEKQGITTIAGFAGTGKNYWIYLIAMLTGLISLTGLPPTSGFSAKLFVFSSVWQSYEESGKIILLWLIVLGLLNTVVSLFYYLKIPYYGFLKDNEAKSTVPVFSTQNFITIENLLGFILVLLILGLFFAPGLLMGWINKVNFVF
jgi:NADH-quinone oxidoreductase subunit N